MAFTVKDYHDLVRLLWEHPEWREELRRLLLSDELLTLPQIVKELAEAQRRTEERLSRLETIVQCLTEGQQRLTEQVSALTEQVSALTEGQQHLTEQVSVLTEGQQRLTEQVRALTEGQQRLTDTVGGMKGRLLEVTYQRKAAAYFGPLLRGGKVIDLYTLDDALEAALAPHEFHDVFQLDLLVTGKLRHVKESPDVWLAVEISSVVDRTDVNRAVRRAALLRKAGYCAVPVVAGEQATKGAERAARDGNVALLCNGQVNFWEEAKASWVIHDQ